MFRGGLGLYETTTITSIVCLYSYIYLYEYSFRSVLLLGWCYYYTMSELFNKNRITFNGYKHPCVMVSYGVLWIFTLCFIHSISSLEDIVRYYEYDISNYGLHIERGCILLLVISTILLRANLVQCMHTILSHDSNVCKFMWMGITPHYLFQTREKKNKCAYTFRWSLVFYETIVHVLYGTFLSNYITHTYLSMDGLDTVHRVCISGVVVFTTLFGYHQSFNAMVLVITLENQAWYYNVGIACGIQMISSVGQAILGYKTNIVNRVMTSPIDREITTNILHEFETMTVCKAIKMGYVLNSLGDTIYSIVWGNLLKLKNHTWCVLLWSSILKESIMAVTTLSYALIASNLGEENEQESIKRIITVFTTVYLITNHIVSMILLRKYMTDNETSTVKRIDSISHIRMIFIQLLRCVVFLTSVSILILFFITTPKSDLFVYLTNGVNLLIVVLFFLRIF